MVSIIIPTYNRALYLKETLSSILNQSFDNFEIIVIDDASSDNTKSIITGFNSDKIRYINKGKIGIIAKLRNLGIKESKFDYIAFCDDDDLWHSNKLQRQLEFLKDFNRANLKNNELTSVNEHD